MKNRHIKVFISSTFRDMQDERDFLIKHTFPELRRRCRERGLELTEVDLRWGVTEEQAENGEVLSICLKEIDQARPYFIGLLGERYGWVPPKEHIDPALLESEKWLEEHLDKSVTEMEILHGVLNNPHMTEKAFFYFRNPEYLKIIPQKEIQDFKESDPLLAEKLKALKAGIRKSGFKVEENYNSAEELGKAILENLWEGIDHDFPEGSQPDPLEKEALEHEQFADSRRKVYVGRKAYFERLTSHVESPGPPLVIEGEAGSGKTALVANWLAQYRLENPDIFVLQHYIGSSAKRTDYISIMTRIMQEIKRTFHLSQEVPEDAAKIKTAFPNWLHMAAAKGKIILILDNLNQLENKDDAHELFWLPEFLPASIRLIISTTPGNISDVLKKRNWESYTLEGLDPEEQEQLIDKYLAQYTKKLDEKHIATIVASERTRNPLYLKVLLDELRVFGVFEKLSERIQYYLEAENTEQLYERILERLEEDYEQNRPDLVRDTLCFIWVSRHGLSENELLDLLGSDGLPLPRAVWSPLFLAIEEALVNRLGVLGFHNEYLRNAVFNRYIKEYENAQQLHFHIGQYFFTRENDERKLEELPWQCMMGHAWNALNQVLSDMELFKALRAGNEKEIYQYWTELEANSEFRLIDAYKHILEEPLAHLDYISGVVSLLRYFSHYQEAYELIYHQYKYYFDQNDLKSVSEIMPMAIILLMQLDQVQSAEGFAKQYEELSRNLSNNKGISAALSYQATCCMQFKEYDQALELHQKSHAIAEQDKDELGMATCYLNMSNIYDRKQDYENAIKTVSKAEEIAKKHNDVPLLLSSLNNKGLYYSKMGQPEKAIELHLADEQLSIKYGDKVALGQCYDNLYVAYRTKEDYENARHYKQKQIEIFITSKDLDRLGQCYIEMGNLLHESSQSQEGIEYILIAEDYFKQTANDNKYELCLTERAGILEAIEQYDKALEVINDLSGFYIKKQNKEALAQSLSSQLHLLLQLNQLNEMLPVFDSLASIYSELGQSVEFQKTIGFKALIFWKLDNKDEALKAYKQQEELCRKLEEKADLAENLVNQAKLLAKNDYQAAKEKLLEGASLNLELEDIGNYTQNLLVQADIALKCEQNEELVSVYDKQIEVLKYTKGDESSINVHQRQEEILIKLKDFNKLHTNLHNQSLLLKNLKRFPEALEVHSREEALCKELGHSEGLCISLLNQSIVLQKINKHHRALEKLNELELICVKENNIQLYQACLDKKVFSLQKLDLLKEAIDTLHGLMAINDELEDLDNQIRCKGLCANLLNQDKRPEEALKLHQEEVDLSKSNGKHESLSKAYVNQAVTLHNLGYKQETLGVLKELKVLAEEHQLDIPEVVMGLIESLEKELK